MSSRHPYCPDLTGAFDPMALRAGEFAVMHPPVHVDLDRHADPALVRWEASTGQDSPMDRFWEVAVQAGGNGHGLAWLSVGVETRSKWPWVMRAKIQSAGGQFDSQQARDLVLIAALSIERMYYHPRAVAARGRWGDSWELYAIPDMRGLTATRGVRQALHEGLQMAGFNSSQRNGQPSLEFGDYAREKALDLEATQRAKSLLLDHEWAEGWYWPVEQPVQAKRPEPEQYDLTSEADSTA